ncbi:MAG: ferritin-like domain-containing protein [Acidobacteriaceae bacterium]
MKTIEQEKENEQGIVTRLTASTFNRRSFFKGVGATGLGLAGAAIIGNQFGMNEQRVEAASGVSDGDILNFALNLEYLEAEFYSVSTYGATLQQRGILKSNEVSGPTTGGKMVNFHDLAFLASAIREDEVDHVLYLRAALGAGAVKKPAINLNALGYGFASVNDWLKLGRQFEDVGVSAYLGAAPLITSKTYLGAAAAIYGTEAQHSGSVRYNCISRGVKSPAVDSMDIPPMASTPFFVDKNGLSIPRTTSQVLNIVYGGGKCSGGFYPDGMNGNIACQS